MFFFVIEAFGTNAQPASGGCSTQRVWDYPNKHFATQKWRLYIRTPCLLRYLSHYHDTTTPPRFARKMQKIRGRFCILSMTVHDNQTHTGSFSCSWILRHRQWHLLRWVSIFRAKLQLVADPLTFRTFFPHEFRVEVPLHGQTTYFYQLNHHRQTGQRAFVFDVRKIPAVTMYHVGQRTAGKLFCLSSCLDIRSERFKAGTVLNFRHSASPIYIL